MPPRAHTHTTHRFFRAGIDVVGVHKHGSDAKRCQHCCLDDERSPTFGMNTVEHTGHRKQSGGART